MSKVEHDKEKIVKDDSEKLKSLRSEIEELKDKLLRALAETQNIQKRSEKEKSEISKYSISCFAKDVLSIRDNLQLAINNSVGESETDAVIEGVKLTMSEMDKVLERYGIKMIESMKRPFDPNFHQAMVEIPTDDCESGMVVQVMQEGFMIYDRLLRPALVGVSKKQC